MKEIIIKKHHPAPAFSKMPGQDIYVKGTVQQIADYFKYFLQHGHDWECFDLAREWKCWNKAKIKTAENIKTAKQLLNSLQKAVEVIQKAHFHQDSYEIVEFAPEGAVVKDLSKN